MRESWSDDRLDDLARRVDTGFAQVHEDVAALRVDNKEQRRDIATLDRDLRVEISQLATREELHTRFDALNKRFDDLQRTLIAAILAGFIGLLVTHFG